MIDIHALQRVHGHTRKERPRGILHDRHPASALDFRQARPTIIEVPRQDHASDAPIVRAGSGTEERIDRGPGPILLWAAQNARGPVFEHQVAIGRGGVDLPALDGFPCLAGAVQGAVLLGRKPWGPSAGRRPPCAVV